MSNVIKRDITVAKHKFRIEIYPHLEGSDGIAFEIYPNDYNATLYAFSNKEKLNRLIKEKHIYEPKK